MSEAKKFIEDAKIIAEPVTKPNPGGYMVHFEKIVGRCLHSDYFPEREEEPIETVEMAWELARQFSAADKKNEYKNIYVVNADNFTPVAGYREKAYKYNLYGI